MSSTLRRNTPATKGPAQAGVDLTAPAASKSPPLPHERDEGAGMTDGVPSGRVQQGQRDLERGVQDTSRGTESDTAYRRLKK